jgi:di/tricarboxylate transporter
MSLGAVTLVALAIAVIVSCISRLNVGLFAMALAWIIGVFIGGLRLAEVLSGFPVDLFVTLSGVTLLFAQAHVNGTLDIVAHNAMRLCRGRVGLVPIMYFVLGAALASAGPGNIATTGLLAPMAMATAQDAHVAVPDGHHGWQRLQRGLVVAAGADGAHR